ncbi:MAG: response regulator transcription factor [Kiritimatiellae bacterium]|nr:response regulator transcription factor [Kiritimatiellia bacterium]MDD5522537.1 response regulator transcription factor [Kiritimatiellia bacterium]
MAIRIMLADDHKMIRDGLRALIEKHHNMEVIGEAADGQAAVQTARKLSPDVIVIDIGMPELNGIEATRQITALKCKPKVIGLSMHADRRYVSQMLKAGASGYILKDSAFEELVQAIETVAKGRTYLSPQIAGTVVTEFKRTAKDDDGSVFSVLTEREREVLQQISEGVSTKEIASSLGISVKTIETHRRQIMEKLNLHSVAELTKYAVKEGLTELDK